MFTRLKINRYFTKPDSNTFLWTEVFYYQEKKIINLLLGETIGEVQYQELYLLTQIKPSEQFFNCFFARDIWFKLAQYQTYSEFLKAWSNLKIDLLIKLDLIETHPKYQFKAENTIIGLPGYLIETLSQRTQELLLETVSTNQYITTETLMLMRKKNNDDLESCKDYNSELLGYRRSKAYLEQEQDAKPDDIQPYDITDMSLFEACENFNGVGFDKLIELINKMRFFKEFISTEKEIKLENALAEKVEKIKIKVFGMSLLLNPTNHFSKQTIQNEINKLFLEEIKDIETIKDLVKKGAEINAIDFSGTNKLEQALSPYNNIADVIPFLLESGIDVDKPTRHSQSILLTVFSTKHLNNELIIELISHSKKLNNQDYINSILHSAVNNNRENKFFKVIRFLIEKGASFLARDKQYGDTCLITAVKGKNFDL